VRWVQHYTPEFKKRWTRFAKRDRRAARRVFTRAVTNNSDNRLPKIVNIDKSGANNAGLKDYNRKQRTTVLFRQADYLYNTLLSKTPSHGQSASRAR
jgi:transposase-like protein